MARRQTVGAAPRRHEYTTTVFNLRPMHARHHAVSCPKDGPRNQLGPATLFSRPRALPTVRTPNPLAQYRSGLSPVVTGSRISRPLAFSGLRRPIPAHIIPLPHYCGINIYNANQLVKKETFMARKESSIDRGQYLLSLV